jgi:hypothetical protein
VSEQKQIALDVLLDKLIALYPHGIPREALRRPPVATTPFDHAAPAQCVFCVVSASEITPGEHELLAAIAEKGLRLTLSDYEVVVVPDVTSARRLVADLKGQGSTRVVLVFGTATPAAEPSKSGPLWVLGTHSISEIAASIEVKKAFWQHLKGLLSLLSDH